VRVCKSGHELADLVVHLLRSVQTLSKAQLHRHADRCKHHIYSRANPLLWITAARSQGIPTPARDSRLRRLLSHIKHLGSGNVSSLSKAGRCPTIWVYSTVCPPLRVPTLSGCPHIVTFPLANDQLRHNTLDCSCLATTGAWDHHFKTNQTEAPNQ